MSYRVLQDDDACEEDLDLYRDQSLLYSGKSFTQLGLY